MVTYERLLSYGNVFPLTINCDIPKLLEEIEPFPFRQYNTLKPQNPREGLSITSLNGDMNGDDLESLKELGKYTEMSFRTLTSVYYASSQVRQLIDPFRNYLGRTHILKFQKGGYFPPHRDCYGSTQHSFRVIVPLVDCNPPELYFMMENQPVYFNHGYAYFMNTNMVHSVFSFIKNSMMIVMNVEFCEETFDIVTGSMLQL